LRHYYNTKACAPRPNMQTGRAQSPRGDKMEINEPGETHHRPSDGGRKKGLNLKRQRERRYQSETVQVKQTNAGRELDRGKKKKKNNLVRGGVSQIQTIIPRNERKGSRLRGRRERWRTKGLRKVVVGLGGRMGGVCLGGKIRIR